MSRGSFFHPTLEDLPAALPVFPLSGALLLPRGRLPLNIFEPRYLAMVQDALGQGRMIGMIQPVQGKESEDSPPLYRTGCVGRITSFSETEDGRFLITLTGVARFQLGRELTMAEGDYRLVAPVYAPFAADLEEDPDFPLDRERLLGILPRFFGLQGMDFTPKSIEGASDWALVTSLSMICPFGPREKQALLEAETIADRADILCALLEMAVLEAGRSPSAKPQ